MDVCRQKVPELAGVTADPEHRQACFLDEETKDREVARLLAATMAGAS
jgi:hypothetical protein